MKIACENEYLPEATYVGIGWENITKGSHKLFIKATLSYLPK